MAALRWRSDGLCVYRHMIVTAADISGWVHRLTQRRDPIRDWYFSAMVGVYARVHRRGLESEVNEPFGYEGVPFARGLFEAVRGSF